MIIMIKDPRMKVLPLTQATIAADVVGKGKGPLRKAGGFFLLFMCAPSQAHDTSHRALPVGRISRYLSQRKVDGKATRFVFPSSVLPTEPETIYSPYKTF